MKRVAGPDSSQLAMVLFDDAPRQVSRPSPVPCPNGLVVKNGVKIRSAMSSGMPGPSPIRRAPSAGPNGAAASRVGHGRAGAAAGLTA